MDAAIGALAFAPRIIGIKKMQATAFKTILIRERKRVTERTLSKAFQAVAFLRGLPAQTERIVKIHNTSITTVIMFNRIIYIITHTLQKLVQLRKGQDIYIIKGEIRAGKFDLRF